MRIAVGFFLHMTAVREILKDNSRPRSFINYDRAPAPDQISGQESILVGFAGNQELSRIVGEPMKTLPRLSLILGRTYPLALS